MTTDALNEKYAKLDRLQLIALAGLMLVGTAFVFSATMVSPIETEKIWFAQTWFRQVVWYGWASARRRRCAWWIITRWRAGRLWRIGR